MAEVLPSNADEDWRYVDLAPLAAATPAIPADRRALAALVPAGAAGLVLADGAATPIGAWPAGLALGSNATAPAARDDLTFLRAAGAPAATLQVSGQFAQPLVVVLGGGASRLIVTAAAGTSLRLSVLHAGDADRTAWIDLRLAAGANVELAELQPQRAGILLSAVTATVARDAQFAWTAAGVGGRLVRHRVEAELTAAGAGCRLDAAAAATGSDQIHHLTRVVHRTGPTASRQRSRKVLRGSSRSSFDGLVAMPPGADGASAQQEDRNLLLSPTARAATRPQLDIRADEVEAAQGATVGSLDPEELFYLRARGLSAAGAGEMVAGGFLDEVLVEITDPWARALARSSLGVDHAV
jgi:Fe-S cluster assembly protein SufD